ncbi:MAG: transferase [Rhodoferax sp.]|uniref:spermine/spermidine synthase domain-containing protein n=1 Tax=Rhodoferax sp. TaxID=50421 RepID=UPI002729254D|nr:transferase [Rhodoferax sp.]MDO8449861.1 transferase [Rhodoferax sp.]
MAHTESGASEFDAPFVFSADGKKSLYFTLDQLQSRMCSGQPAQLEVDYTRTMMGFLMFDSHPASIAMIGLGGGSLLKFCHRHLPDAQLTAVEINPHVIALRREFEVPEDDERIAIICADGADFVRELSSDPSRRYDVLLVDGFDSEGQAPSLCTQRFYDDCFQTLSPEGILVVNLHHDHPDHSVFTGRIRLAFDGNLLEVASKEKSNSIVFARKGRRISVDELRDSDPLENFDPEVRAQLQREFSRISWDITQPV